MPKYMKQELVDKLHLSGFEIPMDLEKGSSNSMVWRPRIDILKLKKWLADGNGTKELGQEVSNYLKTAE